MVESLKNSEKDISKEGVNFFFDGLIKSVVDKTNLSFHNPYLWMDTEELNRQEKMIK